MSNKTKLVVQVPDEIIRNKYFDLDKYSFGVYTLLLFLQFRQFGKQELDIDHRNLMHKLYISDTRTLKKALKVLHKNGLIKEDVHRLPTKGSIKITLNDLPFETQAFTQLPVTVFNKVEHIGLIGLRLMFYYESYINRYGEAEKQFCFASLETISDHLKFDEDTITKYNQTLSKNRLLKVTKHKLECTYEYDEFDNIIFTKYNNHYHVKLDNI